MQEKKNNSETGITEFKNEYGRKLENIEWRYSHPPSRIEQAAEILHENMFDPKLTVKWLREQCRLNGNSF